MKSLSISDKLFLVLVWFGVLLTSLTFLSFTEVSLGYSMLCSLGFLVAGICILFYTYFDLRKA